MYYLFFRLQITIARTNSIEKLNLKTRFIISNIEIKVFI